MSLTLGIKSRQNICHSCFRKANIKPKLAKVEAKPETHHRSTTQTSWHRFVRQRENIRRQSRTKTCRWRAASTRLVRWTTGLLSLQVLPQNYRQRWKKNNMIFQSSPLKLKRIWSAFKHCWNELISHNVHIFQVKNTFERWFDIILNIFVVKMSKTIL